LDRSLIKPYLAATK